MPSGTSETHEKIAIIAGAGTLPMEIANGAVAAGLEPFLVGIKGEADPGIQAMPHVYLGYGQLGKLFETLAHRSIERVIFVGGIEKRPDYSTLVPDWQTVKTLPRILKLLASGDSSLLSGVVSIFEEQNLKIVGVADIAPHLVCENGRIAGRKPGKKAMKDIMLGFRACKAVGALDIGQATIVERGRIIGVEAAEGTDALISRIADLRKTGRISAGDRGGVLVKTIKPGQDMRADLPSIGPETITRVSDAGLSGIVLEAGHSLILDRENTVALAKEMSVFILGLEDPGAP